MFNNVRNSKLLIKLKSIKSKQERGRMELSVDKINVGESS
jgi:hypothetical protein